MHWGFRNPVFTIRSYRIFKETRKLFNHWTLGGLSFLHCIRVKCCCSSSSSIHITWGRRCSSLSLQEWGQIFLALNHVEVLLLHVHHMGDEMLPPPHSLHQESADFPCTALWGGATPPYTSPERGTAPPFTASLFAAPWRGSALPALSQWGCCSSLHCTRG